MRMVKAIPFRRFCFNIKRILTPPGRSVSGRRCFCDFMACDTTLSARGKDRTVNLSKPFWGVPLLRPKGSAYHLRCNCEQRSEEKSDCRRFSIWVLVVDISPRQSKEKPTRRGQDSVWALSEGRIPLTQYCYRFRIAECQRSSQDCRRHFPWHFLWPKRSEILENLEGAGRSILAVSRYQIGNLEKRDTIAN